MGAEVGLDASLGPGSLLPERLHGKSTRVIQVDFTGGLEIYEAIEAGLKDLEIGVLGMSPCLLGGTLPLPAPCSP